MRPSLARRLLRSGVLAVAIAGMTVLLASCVTPAVHVPDAVDVRVDPPSSEELQAAFVAVPAVAAARSERLLELFRAAGCTKLSLEHSGAAAHGNVVCILPGESPLEILVGAHVDPPTDGMGLVENWSGVALLPALYQALRVAPRRHTFVFVGFASARLKQRGSRGYLRRLGPEGRKRIQAMVNLKALGVGTTAVWHTKSHPDLVEDLYSVAMAMDLPPLRYNRFYSNATADSKSFRYWGIPTITVHSLDKKTSRVLSEPVRDGRTILVDPANYHDSARLIAIFLGYIDDTLGIRRDRRGL